MSLLVFVLIQKMSIYAIKNANFYHSKDAKNFVLYQLSTKKKYVYVRQRKKAIYAEKNVFILMQEKVAI